MKKDLENSKILRDELVYIPSGLISEGGTDIMSWTLKEYLSNEELKDKEVYTLNKIGHIFCIKEDDEEYYTNSNYNCKHDKLFKIILGDKIEAAKFMNKVLKIEYKIKSEKMELYNKEYITTMFEKMESDIVYKISEKNTYIIIEHQSTVDKSMPYRMFQYTAELLREVIDKEKSIEGILKALEQINKKLSINSDKRQMQLFITIVRYVLLSINDEETRKKLEKEIEKMQGVEGNMLHATMVLNEAFEKREKKGKSEGVKNEKIATAKRLLKKKMKPDFISEITGLSIEEIEKLK